MNSPTTSFLVQQLAYSSLAIVVYLVGLVLAVIFIKKYPVPAILTLLAAVILLVNVLGTAGAQTYLMRLRFESNWTIAQYGDMMSLVSIIGSISRALGSALLLAAVFVGRKSKTIQV